MYADIERFILNMKIIIEQTDSDGRIKYIERVASCRPEGNLFMSSDVFEDATLDLQWEVDHMPDGRDKWLAMLQFADCCKECGDFDKALDYYVLVLEKTISNQTIIPKYFNLAEKAYQGVVCCNSCSDEYIWEMSSEILAGYRHLFQEDDDKRQDDDSK